MCDVTDVISFSQAAEQKSCSRATLYRAVDDGRLNDVVVGDRRMLIQDEKWNDFEPEIIGLRARKLSDTSNQSS
jgi:excisionase family DNA binding protein